MTKNKKNLFSFAFGETPEEATRNAAIKFLDNKFKRTGDMATLAQLAQLDPPVGNESSGKIIAEVLLNKKTDNKAYNDAFWRELDRVFNYYRDQGYKVVESYTKAAEIFFPDDKRDEPKQVDNIKKQHKRWLKKAGQNF